MNPLEKIRQWLHAQKVEAVIIPSNDPHFSEYVADYWKTREWTSGFTGSAATVVVTRTKAALWTDSRYFLQAAQELQGSEIELQRMGIEGTPSIAQWIKQVCGVATGDTLQTGGRVAVDGLLFSVSDFERLGEELHPLTVTATEDPFASVWQDRPTLPDAPAFVLEQEYCGESAGSKIERLRAALGMKEGHCYPLVALDEIAWLLNIRGADIDFNPLVVAYAAVEPQKVLLFVDKNKFCEADIELLARSGVEIRAYREFSNYLGGLNGVTVLCNPSGLSTAHYQQLAAAGASIKPIITNHVAHLKAVKNSTEQEGFRKAMLYDGVALVRFEMWLEELLAKGEKVSEAEVAEQLFVFRSDNPLFVGESFPAIVGYRANGAIVHYNVTPESAQLIEPQGFLLIDSGGQYLCGTTDITRTYHLGRPTERERADYTAVLRGMIDLSMAHFPVGTRGTQLDILARSYLLKQGTNFLHGTGHGVGCFLNVHEGPQSIRMNENPVTFVEGMTTSNEPGLYRSGAYGIRIENMMLARAGETTDFGRFMHFETLTLCPIDRTAIDIEVLSKEQRGWLNDYHRMVFERLSPLMSADEQAWLKEKTKAV